MLKTEVSSTRLRMRLSAAMCRKPTRMFRTAEADEAGDRRDGTSMAKSPQSTAA